MCYVTKCLAYSCVQSRSPHRVHIVCNSNKYLIGIYIEDKLAFIVRRQSIQMQTVASGAGGQLPVNTSVLRIGECLVSHDDCVATRHCEVGHHQDHHLLLPVDGPEHGKQG